MKKSSELNYTCAHNKLPDVTVKRKNMTRGAIVKNIISRKLRGENIPSIATEYESLFTAQKYQWENDLQKIQNIQQFAEKTEDFINHINETHPVRYYPSAKTLKIFEEDVSVKPDFISVDDNNNIYLVKMSSSKYSQVSFGKFEDYALGMYGRSLKEDNPWINKIIITHEDVSVNSKLSLTRKADYSHFYEFTDSIKRQFERTYEETKDDPCAGMKCTSCPMKNVCEYTEPPIALEVENAVKDEKDIHLSTNQQAVIDFRNGVARCNAGAGAGKTLVVAMRVAEMLQNGSKPEDFVLITFTKAGAEEMTTRAMSYAAKRGVPVNKDELRSGTINAFCNNIIKEHYEELGFEKAPMPIPDEVKYLYLQDILGNKLPEVKSWNYKSFSDNSARGMQNYYIRIKSPAKSALDVFEVLERDGEEAALRQFSKEDKITILRAYKMYRERLTQNNYITYSDQLRLVMQLSAKHNNVFADMGIKHIIVDEFQDTDLEQIHLLNEMMDTQEFESLLCIGDDSQSIFGFRHTSPEFMINFGKYFTPNFHDFELVDNHRSTKNIIEFANRINDNANHKIVKNLTPTREDGAIPTVKGYYTENQEIMDMADKIQKDWESGNHSVAFLSFGKNTLKKMADELTKRGIPSTLMCPVPYIENSRVAALTTFFDSFFSGTTQGLVDYRNVIEKGAYKNKSSDEIANEIADFRASLEHTPRTKETFMKFAKALDPNEIDACYQDFLDKFEFCETTKQLSDVMEAYKLYGLDSTYKREGRFASVALTTIHSAKGLEWDSTYLSLDHIDTKRKHWAPRRIYDHNTTLPTYDNDPYIHSESYDEDIRLFFVGATRARNKLEIGGTYLVAPPTASNGVLHNRYLKMAYLELDKPFDYRTTEYFEVIDKERENAEREALEQSPRDVEIQTTTIMQQPSKETVKE